MAISTEVKVGAVFFVGLAILAVLIIMVGEGELRLHRRSYTIDVLFDSVGVEGPRKNDSVELGGMEVGKVESLEMHDDKIRVRLRIDHGVEIKKDSEITIREKSLLGGKVIFITMGSPEAETVSAGSTLTGELVPGTTELVVTITHAGEKFERTLMKLEEPLAQLTNTLESMDKITSTIEEGKSPLGKLVIDEELGKKLEKIIVGLEKAVPKMTSALESMDNILKKVEKGEGTLGKLLSEDELYEDVSETLKSAKVAGKKVAEFAERIEKVRTYVGIDSAYNEENSHTLTKIYVRIEPRPDKLYLLGATALTGPGTEWDEKDEADPELDLQIGRRFLDNKLTGTIGLFETRVGAGLDYAFNDRLSLSLEGRDTWSREKDEDIEPFLMRSRLQCRIWRGFYIHAGADNLLDEPALNVGIRVEYDDEDIKYILSTLSLTQ